MKRSAAFVMAFVLASLGPAIARAEMPSLRVRGLLDLVVSPDDDEGVRENAFNHGQSNFDPYNLRLFVEADLGHGFEVFTQIGISETSGLLPDGAYALWTPAPERDLHVEIGKIPTPIGTWAQRTYSSKNPLVGIPMMYQYHTSLRVDQVPPDADALLGAAGQGQVGPDYGSGAAWKGMPIVYDRCWDYGVVVMGSLRPLEFALGATNGTPGVPVARPDWNDGKSVLGRLGLMPWPWLRFGVSGGTGPYLPYWLEASPALAGRDVDDFAQRLVLGDLEILIDRFEVRSEAYRNSWETPTVGDLDVTGGYVEGKAALVAGFYAAGRYELMRFSDLAGATLPEQPWDHHRDRWEVGAGLRVTREATLKAVFQQTLEKIPSADDRRWEIAALQLALAF